MQFQAIYKHFWIAVSLALLLTTSVVAKTEPWSLPTPLIAKIDGLEPSQQRFILSGDALDYLSARQLIHEIESRDAAAIQVMISDLMAVAIDMGYNPNSDMGAIPLNLNSTYFNRVVTPRPLNDNKRAAGPFSVHRYMFPTSGVATFAGAKVAIYPEDLVAGKVDVAIVGVPSNMSSGRRDAGHAPNVMRVLNTIATRDTQSLLNPMEVLSIVDYGNFAVDNWSSEKAVQHLVAMVAETSATGAVPIMVGGDTSILYSGVKGIAQTKGMQSFGVVHFSAHPDAQRQLPQTISDTQTISQLLQEGIINGKHLVQVGLRGDGVNEETLGYLQQQGVKYHTMAEINERGFEKVLKTVKREVKRGPDDIFISIDVSVIEPSQMIAAGRVVADGLRLKEVTNAIRYLCAEKNIVGFEITDMAPMLDFSRLSALNANAVLNSCLVGMAVRKAGFSHDYVHPMALNHGN